MSEKKFWDNFYTKHSRAPFEWLIDTSSIDEIVSMLGKKSPAFLLDAGCGSSLFSTRLTQSLRFPSYLLCADFSRQALELIKSNKLTSNHIDFIECDCKRLPIRDHLFDLVLDKGYLDSLLKKLFIAGSQVSMNEALLAMTNLLQKLDRINESSLISKQPKYLIQITDETPELRISLFDQLDQANMKIDYFFKEINLSDNLVFYAYFISKL